MQTIGLYYPFIRFRSENWLKVALLYWPKIARILPNDYNEQGLYSEPLKDLGFLSRHLAGSISISGVRPMDCPNFVSC